MMNGAYKKSLRQMFIILNIVSLKFDCFGIYCASAIIGMEEIYPDLARG